LGWDSLRHLVLSDKLATDAALAVSCYLREHSRAGHAIFTTADGGKATFAMAEQYARSSGRMMTVWRTEQDNAERRREGHWHEVRRKQDLAARLRNEIVELRRRLGVEERTRGQVQLRRCDCQYSRWGKSHTCTRCMALPPATQAVRRTEKIIAERKRSLEEAERSPLGVIQPLPAEEGKALQVIFFLYMPLTLRQLSRLSFTAQQMLLPRNWDMGVLQAAKDDAFATGWPEHYNSHQASRYAPHVRPNEGTDGAVLLGSSENVPQPHDVPPRHVDHCSSTFDGVWHPDSLAPGRLGWKGGDFPADVRSESLYDPFSHAVPPSCTVIYFTEELEGEDKSLQWAMPQHGWDATDPTRGNLGIVSRGDIPCWMGKEEYLTFGALRSYPLQQLRKLCVALRDKTLPLRSRAVQTLIRQALYHLGEITATTPPRLAWRAEADKALSTLTQELGAIAMTLAETPRDHEALEIVAEMAVFVADWHEPAPASARARLADIPRVWAAQMEEGCPGGGQLVGTLAPVKAKSCLFYMYGILCFGGSTPLSLEDARKVCELRVMAHHQQVLEGSSSEPQGTLTAVAVRCNNVMAGRAAELVQMASLQPSIMTHAIRLVLEQTPAVLKWAPVSIPGERGGVGCFDAVSADGHLYSINLLTGTVLFDGSPPSLLPADIVAHPLYIRSFGGMNMEITATGGG
ncbi:unnamed protein product, partial [Discosporangium mesarthrocarpum]